MSPKKTGMDEFFSFTSDFTKLIGVAFASGFVLLLTQFSSAMPPWPKAIFQLSAVFQVMILILVYQVHFRVSRARTTRHLRTTFLLFAVSVAVYFPTVSMLEFSSPNGDRFLRGLTCTKEATQLFGSACPFLSLDQIAEASFDDFTLWTGAGLFAARILVLSLWFSFLGLLVLFLAIFANFQRKVRT